MNGPQGDISDHVEHMKIVEKEVIGAITINSLVNICHLIPLAYLGNILTFNLFMTYFHEFQIYESTIFFVKNVLFPDK